MKPAQEIVFKHSRNSGDYIPDYNYGGLIEHIKRYAKEKCKEQRELCADRGSIGNAEFIQNAPEPEFD